MRLHLSFTTDKSDLALLRSPDRRFGASALQGEGRSREGFGPTMVVQRWVHMRRQPEGRDQREC